MFEKGMSLNKVTLTDKDGHTNVIKTRDACQDERHWGAAFRRRKPYEMPLEILREAIVNALVHRDYSLASSVRIFMFDDRLEAHSPGKLPNSVTVDNIRAGIHVECNPIILSLMAKLGFMTRLGTGILRIFREEGNV